MLVRLHVDASAALGIIKRRGVGRVRPLDVGTIWLQEQQFRRVVDLRKVEGLKNPGDLCTKYLSLDRIDTYSDMMGYEYASGRADATADLNMLRHVDDVDPECRARVRSVGSLLKKPVSGFRYLRLIGGGASAAPERIDRPAVPGSIGIQYLVLLLVLLHMVGS